MPKTATFKSTYKLYKNKVEPKILCNLQGLLGNLMFQIASVKSHCDRHNYTFEFGTFNNIHTNYPGKDLKLASIYPYTIFSKINNQFNFVSSIKRKHVNEDHGLFYNLDFIEDGNYLLQGYFQNQNLFTKDEAKSYFSFNQVFIPEELNKILRNENCVSIHVRRTDYLHVSTVLPPLSLEYYYQALDEIKFYDKVLIFSDDLKWCKENFEINNSIFIEENELVSMKIMQNCKSNIIANSTFSWWGAYLNEHNKTIMPLQWFGPAVTEPRPLNHYKLDHWIAI